MRKQYQFYSSSDWKKERRREDLKALRNVFAIMAVDAFIHLLIIAVFVAALWFAIKYAVVIDQYCDRFFK